MMLKPKLSEKEECIIQTMENLLSREHVTKSITPITRVCYLHNTEDGSVMRVDGKTVDIFKDGHVISQPVSGNAFNKIVKAIQSKIEEEMLEIDKQLHERSLEILKSIL